MSVLRLVVQIKAQIPSESLFTHVSGSFEIMYEDSPMLSLHVEA